MLYDALRERAKLQHTLLNVKSFCFTKLSPPPTSDTSTYKNLLNGARYYWFMCKVILIFLLRIFRHGQDINSLFQMTYSIRETWIVDKVCRFILPRPCKGSDAGFKGEKWNLYWYVVTGGEQVLSDLSRSAPRTRPKATGYSNRYQYYKRRLFNGFIYLCFEWDPRSLCVLNIFTIDNLHGAWNERYVAWFLHAVCKYILIAHMLLFQRDLIEFSLVFHLSLLKLLVRNKWETNKTVIV